MKLILRDYILSLKEEGELDVLISNLLFAKGIQPLTKTQKGTRQYGVDIVAKGKDADGTIKLFIITVKQNDLSRKIWNSGTQSVQPSLEEIQDVYIRNLPSKLKKMPCKIIVATNGEMKQAVEFNWNAYIDKHSITGEKEFEFWGINYLSIEVEEHLMNEHIFHNSSKQLLQKTLALIDLNEYDLRHFYKLIEQVLFDGKVKNQKDSIRRIRLLNLCQGMILKWGVDGENLKNVYLASERLILRLGDFMRENVFFETKKIIAEFSMVLEKRLEIGQAYFEKIKAHTFEEEALATFSKGIDIEYSLICFEQLGIIAQIGLERLFMAETYRNARNYDLMHLHLRLAMDCCESLGSLIENNPATSFVLYDDHLIDINLALTLFYQTGQFDSGKDYLSRLIKKIVEVFQTKKMFPLFIMDYSKLLDVYLENKEAEVNSSHLMILLAEWSLAYGSIINYDFIRSIIEKLFPKLNLQVWFPDENTEETYFKKQAMHESGTVMVNIVLPKDYRDHVKRIHEELRLYTKERTFSLSSRLNFLPLLSSRHYRNLPFPIQWRGSFETSILY